MSRRNLVHAIRYPIIAYLIALPVIFLLLFVYVLGGTLGAGLPAGDTASYLQYVVPGVLLLSVAGGATGPAISVSQDMTEGIIARFRTMNISRSAVLAGHVIGNLLQLMIATIVVLGVALLMGFRAPADVWGWLGAVGVLTLIAFAMCWLGVAFGVFAKGVESASNLPMPIMILPLLGSGFVPTASMPAWLQWFAEVPAVHTVHRDRAVSPVRHADRDERMAHPGVVRRHHGRQLGLGAVPVRAEVGGALSWRCRPGR